MTRVKKRTATWTVSILLVGLLGAACGDDAPDATTTAASPAGDDTALTKLPDGFPDSPMTIRLPAPGSGTEALGRVFATEGLDQVSPVQVRIDPLPGAGTNDSTASMLNEPDVSEGLHVALITNATVVGTALEQTPFAFDDLRGVATVANTPLVVAVRDDSPWTSFEDFAAAAVADAGKIRVGLAGVAGSLHHVATLRLEEAIDAGGDFAIIPHKDAGEVTLTLLGGGVEAAVGTWSAFKAQVESGDVRVLASMGAERGDIEDVPTLDESGVDLVVENQFWFITSSEVSDEKAMWLGELFSRAWEVEAAQDGMTELGWTPVFADAAETQDQMEALFAGTREIAADLGLAAK